MRVIGEHILAAARLEYRRVSRTPCKALIAVGYISSGGAGDAEEHILEIVVVRLDERAHRTVRNGVTYRIFRVHEAVCAISEEVFAVLLNHIRAFQTLRPARKARRPCFPPDCALCIVEIFIARGHKRL